MKKGKSQSNAFSRLDNEKLRAELEAERATFLPTWRDGADYALSRRPRFFVSDANKGDRRNQKIINPTGTYALRTLRAGMMSGVTSPSRPWFRLATPDKELAEDGDVKAWLHTVTQRMTSVFLNTNLYKVLPIVYGDLAVFATSPILIEPHPDKLLHFRSLPIGSFMIAQNHYGRVDTIFREFRMTVAQLIEKFGYEDDSEEIDWSKFSNNVKNLYDNKKLQAWIDVCHVIRPNTHHKQGNKLSKFKRFASCYYEAGSNSAGNPGFNDSDYGDKVLSKGGFDYFPVLCPRWELTGEDVYGTSSPFIDAIGDIKALQSMEKRKAQAIEKMVNPPMLFPTALKAQKTSILPGDSMYYDERNGSQGIRAAHEVQLRINELSLEIRETENRIRRAFYEDLFLMLANTDRRDITAREIDERHEEKLLALGPVLEQLNEDLLDPLIDITFQRMLEEDMIPEPPDGIQGEKLRVEYISIMAQAQKMVGISSVERLFQFVGQWAAVDPSVLQKIDSHQGVDVMGDMLSVPPGIIRSDKDAQEIAANQAKAAQQVQAQEGLANIAGAARDLSGATLDGNNVLSQLTGSQQSEPQGLV